jgi:integrase
MPKKAKDLTYVEFQELEEPGLHAVGGVRGLCIKIKPSGARSWILRAVVGKRRPDIGLGGFPEVSLGEARKRAREMRKMIDAGKDPLLEKRAARSALEAAQAKNVTFAQAAKRWHREKSKEFRNDKHAADWLSSLERYAFPVVGTTFVSDIELAHVIKILEPIWSTKTVTATRVRERIESVLGWAAVQGLRSGENPARWKGYLDKVLPAPRKLKERKHYPALPWQEVGEFMADLRSRKGMAARALEFQVLTASRTGAVRGATWPEIDLEARVWKVPVTRPKGHAGTKLTKPHTVHLTDEALALLRALPRLDDSEFVFTSNRGGQMSDMAILQTLKRMRTDIVPHGFRSTFKDWARNSTSFADEVSELALAHVNSDATRSAYARDGMLSQRAEMLEAWAAYCGERQGTRQDSGGHENA